MIKNADITVYNHYYNKETGLTEYHKTHIYGVCWQNEQKASVGDRGLKMADMVNVFIPIHSLPKDKTYVSPKAYAYLSSEALDSHFTISLNDKVVKGILNFDITGVKPNTVKHLEELYDDVVNILSIKEQRIGAGNMHHFQLGGQ